MFRFLVFVFLLLEVATFVLVGDAIGVFPTLGLVLLAALAGMLLLRHQGVAALTRAQEELRAGRSPGPPLASAAVTTVAAILLLIPGFLTDILGLLMLIPPVRRGAWKLIRSRITSVSVFTRAGGFERYGAPAPDRPAGGPVVELERDEYSSERNPESPWRIDRS